MHTFNLSPQSEDTFIYQKATQKNCIVVTIDDDFKKLVRTSEAGVIIAPPDLSVEQMEEELLKFIKGKSPENLRGKFTKIDH